MRFDLADLRLFTAVADAGSITHGAIAAHLSLAAASERLREMEISAGTALLQRGSRGVTLTRAGDALAHHARLVLRQVATLQAELSQHALGMRASIRLLANTAAVTGQLPRRLAPWLVSRPRIDIDLVERTSDETVKALVGGLAPLGIVSDAVETGPLETRLFAEDHLVVVLPRAHQLAAERQIAMAQLQGEEHIAYAGALQQHIDEQASRAGLRLRPRVRLPTFEGICQMAGLGVGWGIVPEGAARRYRRSLPIAVARLSDGWAARRLLLCCLSSGSLDPTTLELYEWLSSATGA